MSEEDEAVAPKTKPAPVESGFDDDLDEPLPARACTIDDETCESCQ